MKKEQEERTQERPEPRRSEIWPYDQDLVTITTLWIIFLCYCQCHCSSSGSAHCISHTTVSSDHVRPHLISCGFCVYMNFAVYLSKITAKVWQRVINWKRMMCYYSWLFVCCFTSNSIELVSQRLAVQCDCAMAFSCFLSLFCHSVSHNTRIPSTSRLYHQILATGNTLTPQTCLW